MFDAPLSRVVAVALLVAVLAALCLWLGSRPPATDHPTTEDLLGDYQRYVGQRAVVSGRVASLDPVVVALHDGGGVTVTVRDLRVAPDVGDEIQVFGVVEPGRELAAVDAVVVPPWGRPYAYGVSALAGVWVLVRLARQWHLDRDTLGLSGGDA